MAKDTSQDESINWDEIPPVGGLFMLLFLGGFFALSDFSGNMLEFRAATVLISLAGIGYFGLRYKQIMDEEGLKKATKWATTAPADRKKNQFSSPSLDAIIPDKEPTTQGRMDLNQLRSMDEYKFEKLVSDVWQEMGFETRVTQSSNDRGVDVIAEKDRPYHQKKIIQAKRYSEGNKVGSEEVQRYDSLRRQEDNVDEVIIVTTSSFTRPAERTADDLNVKPVDGHSFLELYQENMEKQEAEED